MMAEASCKVHAHRQSGLLMCLIAVKPMPMPIPNADTDADTTYSINHTTHQFGGPFVFYRVLSIRRI